MIDLTLDRVVFDSEVSERELAADAMADLRDEQHYIDRAQRVCSMCHGTGYNCPECGGDDDGDEDDSLCQCGNELTIEELDSGQCDCCGKGVLQ